MSPVSQLLIESRQLDLIKCETRRPEARGLRPGNTTLLIFHPHFILIIIMLILSVSSILTFTVEGAGVGKSNVTLISNDVSNAGLEVPEGYSDEVAMIQFSDDEPVEGEIVIINASVFNIGTRSASVTVYFYDGPKAENDLIGISTLEIHPLGYEVATTDWDTTGEAEFHTIHVIITPDDPANETDDTNNQAEKDIVVNQIPTAAAGIDLSADEDDELTFDGSGSTDTQSDLTAGLNFIWDFNDPASNTSNPDTVSGINLSRPSHTFTREGVYKVELTIKDDGGAFDKDTIAVTISNIKPVADLTLYQTSYFEDDMVTFYSNQSRDTPSDKEILLYNWDFGDGASSGWLNGTETTHTYTHQGDYSVILTVKDDDNLTGTDTVIIEISNLWPTAHIQTDFDGYSNIITFNASGTTDSESDMATLRYDWDMGDGTTDSGVVVTHQYSDKGEYTILLKVTDDDGETDEYSLSISILNIAPEVVIEASTVTADEDEVIYFYGGNSSDADGEIIEYRWLFDDGSEVYGPETERSFPEKGTHTVFLFVEDDYNAENFAIVKIVVNNLAPYADAGVDKEVYEGDSVFFDAGNSSDTLSDISLLEYVWDFGDGKTGKGETISHVYDKAGEYNVNLTVTDDDGASTVSKIRVYVRSTILSSIRLTSAIDPDTCMPGDTVSITGTVDYDFTDRIPDNDISISKLRIEILETGAVYHVIPDLDGSYSKMIPAPEKDGTYTIKISITRLGILAEETETLTVETPEAAVHAAEGFEINIFTVAIVATVLSAAGGTGAFVAGTDLGRYKFFALLIPLYTRLNKNAVLDNFTRGRIYEHIRMHPGQHYRGIKNVLELNNGCLTYHLKVLERSSLIQSRTDGTHKRFYPAGMKIEKGQPGNIQELILQKIHQNPYSTQKELASEIGIDVSTVNYHINIMVGAGIIQSEKRGKTKHYSAVPEIVDLTVEQ